MKKIYDLLCIVQQKWKKTIRVMKLTFGLILFTMLTATAVNSYSQTHSISLKLKNANILDVFKEIERTSDFGFFFKSEELNLEKRQSINFKGATIDDIMKKVLDEQYSYRILDKNIVVTKGRLDVVTQQKGKKVTGKITDKGGNPLPGVSVVVKGSTTGVITDASGNYSISNIPENAILQFSFIGMRSQEVVVTGRSTIDITLTENIVGLDEVVVVGYGVQKRENLASSISTIKPGILNDKPTASAANLLQGTAAGVLVSLNGGYPGAGASIKIRETGSWTGGSTPLYVIDGVQRSSADFAALNPTDIDNISILKDAGSAAIYGIQAANGVILVTTKTGKGMAPSLQYSFNYSMQTPTVIPQLMNAYQSVLTYNKMYDQLGISSSDSRYYSPDEIEYFKTHSFSKYDAAWNNPLLANHNLSMNGSMGNHTDYRISFGYLDQTGATKNSYDKYTTLMSVDSRISKDLELTAAVGLTWDKSTFPYCRSSTDPSMSSFFYDAYRANKTIPATINGLPTAQWHTAYNPTAILEGLGGNVKNTTTRIDPRISLTYKIPGIEGLSVKGSFSYHNYYYHLKRFGQSYNMYYFKTTGAHNHILTNVIDSTKGTNGAVKAQTSTFGTYDEQLYEQYQTQSSYQGNLSLNYARRFGKHDLSAFVAYEESKSKGYYSSLWSNGFPNRDYQEFDGTTGSGDNRGVGGSTQNLNGYASYIGRLDYNYDSKYIFGFTMRVDGTYIFPPDKRWGYFPSFSGAWNIAKESFLEPYKKYLDVVKLRASYGVTGSSNTSAWQWQESYNQGSSGALLGGTLQPSVSMGGSINPNVTWEKNYVTNLGLDLAMPNRLASLTVDAWYKKTTDILGSRSASVPSTVGASLPAVNYGEGSAQGLDVTVGHANKIGDLNYSLQFNLGYSSNKYLKVDQAANVRPYEDRIGTPMNGGIWGLHCEGIIRTQADVDKILAEHGANFTIFGRKPEPGMLMYSDVRGAPGTDKADGKIDGYDMDWLTWNATPRINYGFNITMDWKGFDLSVQFSGVTKYKIYTGNGAGPGWDGQTSEAPTTDWLDMWTPENTNASLPSAVNEQWAGKGSNIDYTSDFWIKDGSYLRLSSLVIGYTLPSKLFKHIPTFKGLRVYCSGTNLFYLTKSGTAKYYDPENISIQTYPITKTFTFGVSANF